MIVERVLRLNALTSAYGPLWEEVTGSPWTPEVPLRNARDRREAQIEIDALVSLSLGITAEELVTVYRTQFPVLHGYDRSDYLYDATGRVVPTSVRQTWKRYGSPNEGLLFPAEDRTVVHPGSGIAYEYQLPFAHLDREADLRSAYARFA